MSLRCALAQVQPRHPVVFILSTALFLSLTANVTFFNEVAQTYPPIEGNWPFLASVAVLLVSILAFSMSLFSLVMPLKIVLSVFLLVGAVAGYYTDHFGAVVDSIMIANVVETDPAEVRDLITLAMVMRLALLGLLPTVLVWWVPLKPVKPLPSLLLRGSVAAASVLIALGNVLWFSSVYAGFFRENARLRYYTNPLTPIYSGVRYVEDRLSSDADETLHEIAGDARIPETDEGHELIILVVGETARWDRFSLNGYEKQTNPRLEGEARLVSYTNIRTCGTSTAVSVPCMFARNGRRDFEPQKASSDENLLDVLHRAGVSILWRDNNSNSKGVAIRLASEDFRSPKLNPACDTECRDVGMLDGLQAYIDRQPGDILIVLHQMGNHGPAYYKRYPGEFEQFKPACRKQELSSCTDEEISNAYDNAILYTDYFLSQVIELLKANTPAYETAMLYVSDHGESLGEYGLYLHGAPYSIAPEEQTRVPVLLWLGESSDIDLQQALAMKDQRSSHDAIFSSLLSAFEVETSEVTAAEPLF